MTAVAEQPTLFDQPRGKRLPVAVRFAAWRRTPDGEEVARLVAGIALDYVRGGVTRISVNQIFEALRAARHKPLDNSMRAGVARELVGQHPELRGKVELRRKRGAQ